MERNKRGKISAVFFAILFLFACAEKNVKESKIHDNTTTQPEQTAEPFVVLELFSSEGCSDCPDAEAILNKITLKAMADKSYIYPLAFHVDYWNKLGWKDAFSDTAFSNRQRKYRDAFKNEVVYTPQLIVNGEIELPGGDEKKADSIIAEKLRQKPGCYFTIHPNNDWTSVDYEILQKPKELSGYKICVAIVERGLVTSVGKGENKGRELKHENIVRSYTQENINAEAGTIKISKPISGIGKNHSIIVFIQDAKTMKIIGANLWNY